MAGGKQQTLTPSPLHMPKRSSACFPKVWEFFVPLSESQEPFRFKCSFIASNLWHSRILFIVCLFIFDFCSSLSRAGVPLRADTLRSTSCLYALNSNQSSNPPSLTPTPDAPSTKSLPSNIWRDVWKPGSWGRPC